MGVVDDFHIHYYENPKGQTPVWGKTTWMGHPLQKCPMDLWVFQEILCDTKPALIIECGTFMGGSALYLAGLCDLMNQGQVVSIDISPQQRPYHQRVTYIVGSSIHAGVVHQAKDYANGRKTMVILDSCHEKDHGVGRGSCRIVLAKTIHRWRSVPCRVPFQTTLNSTSTTRMPSSQQAQELDAC